MHMRPVLGLILAGGEAVRFGGSDKCLQPFQGRPLLAHIQERLEAQTSAQALSANGDPARFERFGMPVLGDMEAHRGTGPIAGLICGLTYARDQQYDLVLSVPCDAPVFPTSLTHDLHNALQAGKCARAASGGSPHPVFSLWHTASLPHILKAAENGVRALWRLQEGLSAVTLSYDTVPFDPFMDADTPEELAALERTVCGARSPHASNTEE